MHEQGENSRHRSVHVVFAFAPVLLLTLAIRPALAEETQPAPVPPPGATRIVAAGTHYKAGPLHRLFFGEGHRSLWQASFAADVLDLSSFDGGLTPKKKGGGKQTLSLTFEGHDGREWKFRQIDKDPSAVLPEELRGTFVDTLVQDQVSSAHPLGPLVVDPLAEAAGILAVPHRLFVLPDDERLGVFRKEFGGKLGFLEEKIRSDRPSTQGFEGFHPLLDTVELWKRLDEHPEEKVDAPALLRARLFDFLINDFDRHKNQWQWARLKGSDLWQPVPEDRDQAFVRYSGLVLDIVRGSQPRLVDFGPKYPSIFGLSWQGRFVDRRHLSELEWPQWQEAIQSVRSKITDASIDGAIGRLPEEYRQMTSGRTGPALKSRLRLLGPAARKFYEQLAEDVEIHCSDKDETAFVTPAGGRLVQVRVVGKDGSPRFVRRFDPRETHSVRLYMKGGDDRVVRESGTDGITFRVVGGKGEDVLDDSKAGWTHFYDEGAKTRVTGALGTSTDNRPYEHPLDSSGNPERDWGQGTLVIPWLSGGGDLGLVVGGNLALTKYSFRHHPYNQSHTIGARYSTGLNAFGGEYKGVFVRENGAARLQIHARASALDLVRFYGFGNETKSDRGEDFFKIQQQQFSLSPQFQFRAGHVDVSVGAMAQYTKEPDRPSFLAATRPYGFGGFGKVGPKVDIEIGHREAAFGESHGRVMLGGSFFPKTWSVKDAFGEIHGEAGTFLRAAIPMRPALALRAGGKRVFGRYPFQEAAFLGGSDTVRGLRPQRYAGDGSAFGSAELRLRFGRVKLLLPSEVGVFGLADAGRVFLKGERSDLWHHSVGGGVWVAILKPENTVSLAIARADGVTRIYFRAGFGF